MLQVSGHSLAILFCFSSLPFMQGVIISNLLILFMEEKENGIGGYIVFLFQNRQIVVFHSCEIALSMATEQLQSVHNVYDAQNCHEPCI